MKLSIITINYNDAPGLRKTIESVIGQSSRKDFEYIVVDGGSSDGSKAVLEEFSTKIDKWVSEPDKGIYNAMNKGVAMASGEYLQFLNSGDTLHGDSISEVLPALQGSDIVIGRMIFNNTGNLSTSGTDLTMKFFIDNSLPHDAAFIRSTLLKEYPYDESLRIASDWKFFVETIILHSASYRWIDTVVTEFDCNGISSKNRHLCDEERDKVLAEMLPPRVLIDYKRHFLGAGYTDTTYDKFYSKARSYRSGKVLYSLNVLTTKFLALFKKSARWVRPFPVKCDQK